MGYRGGEYLQNSALRTVRMWYFISVPVSTLFFNVLFSNQILGLNTQNIPFSHPLRISHHMTEHMKMNMWAHTDFEISTLCCFLLSPRGRQHC